LRRTAVTATAATLATAAAAAIRTTAWRSTHRHRCSRQR
jgi:hypothetical protein